MPALALSGQTCRQFWNKMRTSRQVWAGGRPKSLTQEKSLEQNSENLPSQFGFYRTRSLLATLVSHSLTDFCLVDLIDVTLACEDAKSILVEVVLLLILRNVLATSWANFKAEVFFLHKAKFFRLWTQDLVMILKLKFGQYFTADVWLRLWSWILVEILRLSLVKMQILGKKVE